MFDKRCLVVLLIVSLAACSAPQTPVPPTPADPTPAPTTEVIPTPTRPTTTQPTATPSAAPEAGTYLGETPPGAEPLLFRPDAVSTGAIELSLAMHPNGQELYFTRLESGQATILLSRQAGGGWTTPEPASFSGAYDDVNPFISADGQRLYFSSKRPPAKGTAPDEQYHIWFVERAGDGWSNPTPLALPLESAGGETSCSVEIRIHR